MILAIFPGHTHLFSGWHRVEIDDLHRRLTEDQVGVKLPLKVIRHTEKLVLKVIPLSFG